MTSATVLIVEDDASLREALQETLELAGIENDAVSSAENALEKLAKNNYCMVLTDVNMPGMDGFKLLKRIQTQFQYMPVVLMTAFGSIGKAVEAIRNGAVDYLVKPFEPKYLIDVMKRYLPSPDAAVEEGEPIAIDSVTTKLFQLAKRVAESDSTVLILGESGTGKEVLARYIHNHSARSSKPFIAINCAAIPDNMLEAILFGHEKGSFTGAHQSSPGKFELANGGTLLLDEISEMSINLQAKLLRVLQEREVERVGGRQLIALDVRVIATSNRKLEDEVKAGRFREDLYYRLNVFPLTWQPLRNRIADIVPLATYLLEKHSKRANKPTPSLSDDAKLALQEYEWPGNVRELENVVQRALILQQGNLINADDLMLPEAECQEDDVLFSDDLNSQDDVGLLDQDLRQREVDVIVNTLKLMQGSKKKTAEKLGISARTLRYKLAKLREMGIDVDALACA